LIILQVLFSTLDLDLSVAMHADGSADVRGMILLRGDGPPALLVADSAGATTSCAELDGDGAGGLVRLAAPFRDVRTGELVPVVIAAGDADLDASGVYALTVEIGGVRAMVEARVHVPPGRPSG
jgi:hypothetical protein